MKRFLLLIVIAVGATGAWAQKAEVAVVAGETFTSNATQVLPGPPADPFPAIINSRHQIFLQGTVAVRWVDAKVGALYLELPVAYEPSQVISVGSPTSTLIDRLSSFFVTPSVKLKLLPSAPISPWVSAGFGLAHYSSEVGGPTNKGALQYGGGVDFKTRSPVLSIRAEVRDFLTSDPRFGLEPPRIGVGGEHRHNILAGGGIVFHF